MFTLGVGTSKDLPSLLAGGGFRFSKPSHFSVSFGGLWTWRQELDKLKVGDVITGTTDLTNDLKYKFMSSPAFFIGINYGF
jgi:hypothetical protein